MQELYVSIRSIEDSRTHRNTSDCREEGVGNASKFCPCGCFGSFEPCIGHRVSNAAIAKLHGAELLNSASLIVFSIRDRTEKIRDHRQIDW